AVGGRNEFEHRTRTGGTDPHPALGRGGSPARPSTPPVMEGRAGYPIDDRPRTRSLQPAPPCAVCIPYGSWTDPSSPSARARLPPPATVPPCRDRSVMASEPNSPAAPVRAVDKIRFTLRKDGSLRWLSHHDLLRTFERMLRRAELPVHHSRGFHPHPRLIFALSLPLGVIGLAEIVEVELDEPVEPAEALRRINAQSPHGLTLL